MRQVILQECENGNRDIHTQSSVPVAGWPNGREDSRWLCQLHRQRHGDIVDNPLFRNDRKFQVEKCNEKMVWGTTFYGPDRPIYKDIKWKKVFLWLCKDVVKKNFKLVQNPAWKI